MYRRPGAANNTRWLMQAVPPVYGKFDNRHIDKADNGDDGRNTRSAGFVFKHPLADVAAKATAPIGATFTSLALITGALWGKPSWGTYWVWDARLTSVLILLFLYLGYMAIWEAIEDKTRAARIAAIVAIVGFVNVPIIKFSVDWWNSLHQPASIIRSAGPSIHGSMLTPLLLMAIAYMAIYGALVLQSMRNELAARRIARLEQQDAATISEVRVA